MLLESHGAFILKSILGEFVSLTLQKYIGFYLSRQKLWPRLWETYGEDVKLVKDMGRVYTESMQGNDLKSPETVAACLKSFVGYGHPQSGLDRTPAWIDERQMHEYFLPPFEESVRAGAVSVMISPGDVNGIPGHANYHLMTEILKEKYQFQGFALSDWVRMYQGYGRTKRYILESSYKDTRRNFSLQTFSSLFAGRYHTTSYCLSYCRDTKRSCSSGNHDRS